MFSYNNAPFTQVVSGLKDSNCILTVQINHLKDKNENNDEESEIRKNFSNNITLAAVSAFR